MQAVYRLFWTSDVGFSGMDPVQYETLEAAQAQATDGVAWRQDCREEWRSTVSKYGDVFTVRKAYRH